MLSFVYKQKVYNSINKKEVYIFVYVHHYKSISGSTRTPLHFSLNYLHNGPRKRSASLHALRAGFVSLGQVWMSLR